MVGSLSYARVDVDFISACVPQVCSAFIRSRISISEAVVR